MKTQTAFRLSLPEIPGESSRSRRFSIETLNGQQPRKIAPEKLFADLLKRQGRRIMADVSECPPDTIPAHLARLDGWREIRRAEKFLRARAEKYGVEYVPGGGAKTLLYKPVGVKGGEA